MSLKNERYRSFISGGDQTPADSSRPYRSYFANDAVAYTYTPMARDGGGWHSIGKATNASDASGICEAYKRNHPDSECKIARQERKA